jgi:hypothetical protein
MKIFRNLFKKKPKLYQYEILDYESDGDAIIRIYGDNGTNYVVDLDWENGEMDIEFGIMDADIYDTTNFNVQYRLLNTVSYITKKIAKKCGMEFHTVVFKSSNWRNGVQDESSSDIRTRFFSRYVIQAYPNATVETGERSSIIIKLNNV